MILASVLMASMQANVPTMPAPYSAPQAYCTADRALVRRGWSLFIAKNSVSSEPDIATGTKVMGLASVITPCGSARDVKLDMSRLSKGEIAALRGFVPKGEFVDWAKCLSMKSPAKAASYLDATDRLAAQRFKAGQIGAHDEAAFASLISEKGCAAALVQKVQSQQFYEDLNWFVRIAPRIQEITAWHEKILNA